MSWMLAIDLAIVVLLACAIVVALLLNRKLDAARRDWAALEKLADDFRIATQRAEDGIARLKVSTSALAEQAERAQGLSDDLRYLSERASTAADRLEAGVRTVRKPDHRSVERGDRVQAVPTAPPAPPKPATARPAKPADPERPTVPPEPRSQAERALLEALRQSS